MPHSPAPDSPIHAVFTGDLVASSKHSPGEVDDTLKRIGDEEAWLTDRFSWPLQDARFTRSRGDGWQMVLRPAHTALRRALILKARLRADPHAIPTRIAIGIGVVTSLGTVDLRDAAGDAFVTSGRCLETMPSDETLFLLGSENPRRQTGGHPSEVTNAEKAAVILMNERIARWTREQAEATAMYLHPDDPTLADIADALSISPQAVGYRVRGAGAPAIRAALEYLEPEWERRWTT